jgi:hypothetical protein
MTNAEQDRAIAEQLEKEQIYLGEVTFYAAEEHFGYKVHLIVEEGRIIYVPDYSDPRSWARLLKLIGISLICSQDMWTVNSKTIRLKWVPDPGEAVAMYAMVEAGK